MPHKEETRESECVYLEQQGDVTVPHDNLLHTHIPEGMQGYGAAEATLANPF